MIKISVPNDDSVALFHFGKSLIDMSSTIEGSPGWVVITQKEYDSLKARDSAEVGPIKCSQQRLSEILREGDEASSGPKELEPNTTEQDYQSFFQTVGVEINPKTAASSEFPQKWKEAATQAISEAVQQGAITDTPWDERIHSASKALNADGTWRLRRKPKDMDEAEWTATVQRVQDELRFPQEPVALTPPSENLRIDEGCDHHGTPHVCIAPEPPVTPPGDDFHVDAGVVTEQQVADIPPPPPVPVPQVLTPVQEAKVAEVTMTFPDVMKFLTERHARISNEQVTEIITAMGLKSIMDLNTQPEHTGSFIARVKALLGE